MLVIHDAYHASDLPEGGIGTVGNFDGVHRGQQAILQMVVGRARETGLQSVVITFDPHPLKVLRPEQAPRQITTLEQRERLLDEMGVEVLLVIHFTPEFSRTPARIFVRDYVHRRLGLQEIYVGSSFVFGHQREGDLSLLREMGASFGFAAFGMEEVLYQGRPISSTRIRQAIAEGRIEEANEMLGRPFSVTGVIVRGDRMGRQLGWPTINLMPDNELIPADGVYAGRARFPSFSGMFDCVTNIGTRPTLYENYQRVVESYILDFSADVYGERVELAFHRRLREERIFPNVMELSAQIGRDVEAAREYFAAQRLAERHLAGEGEG